MPPGRRAGPARRDHDPTDRLRGAHRGRRPPLLSPGRAEAFNLQFAAREHQRVRLSLEATNTPSSRSETYGEVPGRNGLERSEMGSANWVERRRICAPDASTDAKGSRCLPALRAFPSAVHVCRNVCDGDQQRTRRCVGANPLAPTRLTFFYADDAGPEGRIPAPRLRVGGQRGGGTQESVWIGPARRHAPSVRAADSGS